MQAEDRLRAGDPDGALQLLQEQVRADPANARNRIFLFQLLALQGEWNRALRQLNVAGELDAGALAMVQTYREALQCEVLRAEVFAGKRSPVLFGQPTQWLALLLEAQRLCARGAWAQAREVSARALEEAPATPGRIDDVPFTWLMDADSRLGPVLEAIVNGRYYWIPLHHIRSIDIDKPEDLRDLVWMPAHCTWANGGEAVALLPTRYPGSESHPDSAIRMARKTDWEAPQEGFYVGLGQRMLSTDSADHPLMDIRRIELDSMAEELSAPDSTHEATPVRA